MMKFKINKTIDQISQIITNIRTLYAQQTSYDGLGIQNAIKMGVTPDELGTGTTLTNTFGGYVYIYSYGNSFGLTFGKLPQEACITLSTMDWGKPSSSGLIGMQVANYNISGGHRDSDYTWDNDGSGYAWKGSKYLPLPVAEAATKCNSTSDSCTIVWVYQ